MTSIAATAQPGHGHTRQARLGMAWVTWRQHRMALTGAAILLGGCALVLGVSGLRMQSAYEALTRAGCPAAASSTASGGRCGLLWDDYLHAGHPLTSNLLLVSVALSVIPLLIGVFAAAPLLAREYERGTFRFAWTQTAGRTRWVVAKLALIGAALTAAAGAFGALLGWWFGVVTPITDGSRWQPDQFGGTAVSFAGWTLLAFAAGAFAGALTRRTVPAMAGTAGCLAALLLVTYKRLDPLLVSAGPLVQRVKLLNILPYQPGSPPPAFVAGTASVVSVPPGSWPLSAWITGPHGRWPAGYAPQPFASLAVPAQNRWIATHHLTLWAAYQPAGRFWLFQSVEGGACLLLALLLGAGTVWLVRRAV